MARDIRGFVSEVMDAKRSEAAVDAALLDWQTWALAEADDLDPAKRPLEIWMGEPEEAPEGSGPDEDDDAF